MHKFLQLSIRFQRLKNTPNAVYGMSYVKRSDNEWNCSKRMFAVAASKIAPETNVDGLKISVLSNLRIKYTKLESAISSEDLSESQLLFLLQCCGKRLPDQTVEQRMQIIEQIWKQIKNPSLEHYKALMTVHQENKYNVEDIGLYLNHNPDMELYVKLLGVSCESGNITQAEEVLKDMKAKGIGTTIDVYNSLILGYSRSKNMEAITDVEELMKISGIAANSRTFTELLKAFLENNLFEKAEQMLTQKGKLLSEMELIEVLKAHLFSDNGQSVDFVKDVIKLLPTECVGNSNIDPNLRNLCTELMMVGKYDEIIVLLSNLPVPEFSINEDTDFYAATLLAECVSKEVRTKELLKLTTFLMESKRNPRALHLVCEQTLRKYPEKSLEILEPLSKIETLRPHYFWPVFLHNLNVNGENGILDTVQQMTNFNVEVDKETMHTFVLSRIPLTLLDVKAASKMLIDRGVPMRQFITPLTKLLLSQQRLDEALEINQLYPTKLDTEKFISSLITVFVNSSSVSQLEKITKLVAMFHEKRTKPVHDFGGNLLMELLTSNKVRADLEMIKKLLQKFKENGVKISVTSGGVIRRNFVHDNDYEQVEECLAKIVDASVSMPSLDEVESNITHPRNMSLKELECQLIELESKNLNTRGVLRRLLQLYVQENKLDLAMQIKDKCYALSIELSPGMLVNIFDLHIKQKDVKQAQQTLKELEKNHPKFRIDDHKFIDFAVLFVEMGDMEGAKSILRPRKLRPTDAKYLEKNVWHLLNQVAIHSAKTPDNLENETKKFLAFLVSSGYTTFSNTSLGPTIREYLLKDKVELAVKEFLEICEKYRKTPLQLELLTILLALTNAKDGNIAPEKAAEHIKSLVYQTSRIHGPVRTNNNLLVTLADVGTEGQLRKFLLNPDHRFDSNAFLKHCEYFCSVGKIEAVLKIAKCSKGLSKFKEMDLLNVILQHYILKNEYTAALTVFNRLIESDDEFKISKEFATNLSNLLLRNNCEVPSQLAVLGK